MRFVPGCHCCGGGDGDISVSALCPCSSIPETLYLTFAPEVASVYHNATLVYGLAPAGWEEWAGASDGPGVAFPSSLHMWWSSATFTFTGYTSLGFPISKPFRYAWACYRTGTEHHQRVWRFSDDGQDLGSIETYIRRPSGHVGAPFADGGTGPTIACSPFEHATTLTQSNYTDGAGGVVLWNGTSPPFTLATPVEYLLSG